MEAQRQASQAAITSALQSVAGIELPIDSWVRAVDFKYSLQPLSTKGSVAGVGGRFNYGGNIDPWKYPPFNALYLGEDEETAYREKFGLARSKRVAGLQPHELALRKPNYVIVRVRGLASNIFDLTEKNVEPFIDAVSRLILFDSTKGDKRCLALFPQQLEGSTSFIELADEAPVECVHRRIDGVSWRDYV